MDSHKINLHYAKALLMLADELECASTVADDMRIVSAVCTENRVLNKVMDNPTIPESKKAAIVGDLFAHHLCKASMAFLTFVVRKKRSVNMRGIANAYLELYREKNNIVLAEFVTAIDIDQRLLDEVKEMVADYTGKDVEFVARVDNRRIGGFYLTFDNNLYDDRIRTKLIKLRNEFNRNEYESKLWK